MKTYLNNCGEEVAPSKSSFSFEETSTGIATWKEPQDCVRCGGSGIWRGGFHTGVCFGCGGDGVGTPYKIKGYTEEAFAKYDKRRIAREKRDLLKAESELSKKLEKFREDLDSLEDLREKLRPSLLRSLNKDQGGFLASVASELLSRDFDDNGVVVAKDSSRSYLANSWLVSSEKSIEALRSIYEKKLEEDKKKESAPSWKDGRFEVSGVIKSTKWVDSAYGSSLKMLVELDDGRSCWGSVPSKLDEVDRGDLVSFKATFSKSSDDDKFAFFKRPSVSK